MKKLAFIFLSLCLTQNLFAGGAIVKSKIKEASFQTTGFFMYLENTSNPNACSRDNAVVLLNTDSNYDKAYALLLAAFYAGKEISGYSDGCTSHDGQTYNTIRGFKYLVVH